MFMKKVCYMVLMIIVIFSLSGCEKKTNGLDKDYYVEGNQEVMIEIDYKSNLFLAKDDMDIYVDNHKFYTVSNGDTNINYYKLTMGTHVLKVATSTYHYASEEFTVENTGDIFSFSIKSHLNSIDLTMTNAGNYYTAMGEEIPETVDDSGKSLSEEQISAAKKNRTVWSYLWMVIKSIIIFLVFAVVIFTCGLILKGIFSALNAEKIGILIELVVICVLSFINQVTIVSFVVPVLFLIMWRVSSVKIKNIPAQYRNFSAIKSSIDDIYIGLNSIVFAVLLINIPNSLAILPIQIQHIEWYMYIYVALMFFYTIFGLQEDLDYPEKVRNYVEKKGIVTEKEIEEFVFDNVSDDASAETIEDAMEMMMRTLADLAKIGLVEKDDDEQCFRRKTNELL